MRKLIRITIFMFYTLTGFVSFGQENPEATDRALASQTMTQRIDELLELKLRADGWEPASPCSDANFLRRAHLDLTGSPASGSEVLDFIEDASVDKREKLIDRLLESPQSAAHFATTWADWLLPEVNSPQFGVGRTGLRSWLRNRFSENLRYDRLVSDLLVSTGPAQTGPTEFFVALEGKPEKIAAKTARIFMGVQLDCAECHDHPFDEWSQRDFWGFAAYFAQMSTNAEQAMMNVGEVTDTGEGEVMLPGSEEIVLPKPLVQSVGSGVDFGTRRQQLTLWLTTPENPFLARATVNRSWALLMGRGLIEPIDDMRSLEIASHPQLLEELSNYFTSTGYDLRDLLRTIAKTRAYSRSTSHVSGQTPEASYAVMLSKPLTEKQISNSVNQIARQFSAQSETEQVVLATQLGKLRGDASEAKLGIVSALVTLHGDLFDAVTREDSSRLLKALEAPHFDEQKRVRWLFLSVLNRQPTPTELAGLSKMISSASRGSLATASPDAIESNGKAESQWKSDLLWALLNSSEFAMTP